MKTIFRKRGYATLILHSSTNIDIFKTICYNEKIRVEVFAPLFLCNFILMFIQIKNIDESANLRGGDKNERRSNKRIGTAAG